VFVVPLRSALKAPLRSTLEASNEKPRKPHGAELITSQTCRHGALNMYVTATMQSLRPNIESTVYPGHDR